MTDEQAAAILARQAKALADTVGVLAAAVDQLDQRAHRSERVTLAVAFGLVVDLILSVAVALLIGNLFSLSDHLQGAIVRESTTRQQALCPLYGLLLGSYNPTSRAEGADRDKYNQAFVTLRDGYDSLDCVSPVVPPRIDQPPATIPPK